MLTMKSNLRVGALCPSMAIGKPRLGTSAWGPMRMMKLRRREARACFAAAKDSSEKVIWIQTICKVGDPPLLMRSSVDAVMAFCLF